MLQLRHALIQFANLIRSRWILRRCDRIGRLTRLTGGSAIVENRGTIEIGHRSRLSAHFAPIELRTGDGGRLSIGDRTFVNYGVSIQAAESVVIGDDVDIGPYCVISDTEAGGLDAPAADEPRPVRIGNGAWLATHVIVRPGATIGEGTVVAAASVVEGELPSFVIAAGSPATVKRHLAPNVATTASLAGVDEAHPT